jgi:hypothetical protein
MAMWAAQWLVAQIPTARFLIEVLDPKPSDAFRLSQTSRGEMLRPHVKVDESSSWALSWQVLHHKKGNLLSHGGDNPGCWSECFTVSRRGRAGN